MSANDDRSIRHQEEIEALEQREVQAVLDADVSVLQTLWADDLIVNSTANLVAGKQILLELIKNGRLRLQAYERRPVRIAVHGDLVVTTGNEVSELTGNSPALKIFVSYMNVWSKRAGAWQLLARHVGLIQREQASAQ